MKHLFLFLFFMSFIGMIRGQSGNCSYYKTLENYFVPDQNGNWIDQFQARRFTGDVNGDGRTDIIGVNNDEIWVSLASELGYEVPEVIALSFNLPFTPHTLEFVEDVDGDGSDELVGFDTNGIWVVDHNPGNIHLVSYWTSRLGTGSLYSNNEIDPRYIVDVNGDGNMDVIGFSKIGIEVGISNGNRFVFNSSGVDRADFGSKHNGWKNQNETPRMLGHFNQDSLIDIIGFNNSGTWLSYGTSDYSFTPLQRVLDHFGSGNTAGGWMDQTSRFRQTGDINGDGMDDIIGFSTDSLHLSINTGSGFSNPIQFSTDLGSGVNSGGWLENNWQVASNRRVVDINNDGMDDIVAFRDGIVYISMSNGNDYEELLEVFNCPKFQSQSIFEAPHFIVDLDGDGINDWLGFGTDGVYATYSESNCERSLVTSDYGRFSDSWDRQLTTPRFLADVNGDGATDILGLTEAGLDLSLSRGYNFTEKRHVHSQFGATYSNYTNQYLTPYMMGDMDGNGTSDLVGFDDQGTWLFEYTGSRFERFFQFAYPQFGSDASVGGWANQDVRPRVLADVDGDGDAEIVGFGSTQTWVADWNGTSLYNLGQPLNFFGQYERDGISWPSQYLTPRMTGDVNDDDRADIIGFGEDGVYVYLSTPTGFIAMANNPQMAFFGTSSLAGSFLNDNEYPRFVVDLNDDDRDDIIGIGQDGVYVMISTGTGFSAPQLRTNRFSKGDALNGGWRNQNETPRMIEDINNDGYMDIIGCNDEGVWVSFGDWGDNLNDEVFGAPILITKCMTGKDGFVGNWIEQFKTPRALVDINADGVKELVGFGELGTYVLNFPPKDICQNIYSEVLKPLIQVDSVEVEVETAGLPKGFEPGLCGNINRGRETWVEVIVPSSGAFTIVSDYKLGFINDWVIQVYSGACNNITNVLDEFSNPVCNSMTTSVIDDTRVIQVLDLIPGSRAFLRLISNEDQFHSHFPPDKIKFNYQVIQEECLSHLVVSGLESNGQITEYQARDSITCDAVITNGSYLLLGADSCMRFNAGLEIEAGSQLEIYMESTCNGL